MASRASDAEAALVHTHEHQEPTLMSSLKAVAFTNFYFNMLLAIVPIAILSGVLHWGDTVTFTLNFIAIVPLAKMLDLGTDELSKKFGQSIGALINASFGNAVELIIGVMALRQGLLTVVQSSLLGSILSNLLFVLGWCFLIGGLYHKILLFSSRAANTAATLLAVTIFGFLIPAAFSVSIDTGSSTIPVSSDPRMINVSHGTSLLLLIAYIALLYFQLVTHPHLYEPPRNPDLPEEEEEEEKLLLTTSVAIGVLIVSAVVIGFCAEYLVDSIEGLSKTVGISETFIGLIILPIVGNAAEHVTALFAAARGKMDLAIGVALGSSMQIALFVTPVLVISGWIMGMPLTLNFPMFDTAVLFVAILITNHLINDGESNWLEGFMLLICYVIVAVAYFYIGDHAK
ncbi:hypothetical protein BASA50_004281 [Batrachochytrium salamandrivorans]|uniref:Vacuolar calcium ion transporter n=1 Tax=Batrachochytrium salamandrivorans TaxID=1357716 RepID=A0ABQ8FG93_9FUNG|nr:hypothetical protein BASA61_009621 [Batrachochytrium salamandrivorans]KAH6581393.1 hypothetical protein BASA60_002450 [Batrachochytrium salamandrivorans]KAH6584779.1 hypothetical protein BASA61_007272 [Batrachochytrium salamandrivorans]KAH6597676.1 hypothetical protein BASA50_004281 [Batrachochytrium salamandrivorans]KAH9249075.1 calcium/proton exchanger [Batrachochytrium salamandrivorans]